jgi:ketosteroid isomerase-like protein
MSADNKAILEKANAAIINGNYEGFLFHCTEDTVWNFIGEQTLNGKEAVREYMAKNYKEPPQFKVAHLIAEGNYVTALGTITLKDEDGREADYSYCDVWRFSEGKMAELKAFVIKNRY